MPLPDIKQNVGSQKSKATEKPSKKISVMNKKEVKYIPTTAACPLASCSCSTTCARYATYQKALEEEDTFCVMNPQLLKAGGDTCPYHLVAEKQQWARGFKRICDTIPAGNAKHLSHSTPYTERRFYKAKNGEFPIGPEMQQTLLNIFKAKGADMSVGFDGYEEQTVLVEKSDTKTPVY